MLSSSATARWILACFLWLLCGGGSSGIIGADAAATDTDADPAILLSSQSHLIPFGSSLLSSSSSSNGNSQEVMVVGVESISDVDGEAMEVEILPNMETSCSIGILSGNKREFPRSDYNVPQLCLGMVLSTDTTQPAGQQRNAVMMGMTTKEQGSLLVMDLDSHSSSSNGNTMIIDLPWNHFPVAITADGQGGIYVALHAMNETSSLQDDAITDLERMFDYVHQWKDPSDDLVTDGTPVLIKVDLSSKQVEWEIPLTTINGQSTIGGIAYIPSRNKIGIVGSSNGEGSAVGAGVSSPFGWDGYLTIIDAVAGTMDDSAAELTHLTALHSIRIQSQLLQDDFLHNICVWEDKVVVVGSTTGKMETDVTEDGGGAIIMLLDMDTLNILWSRQIVGEGLEALQCVTSSSSSNGEDDAVFVAGLVPAGVLVDNDTSRSSNQDIFVTKLSLQDGSTQWIRQIDSRRLDVFSSMFLDSVGNINVVGSGIKVTDNNGDAKNNVFLLNIHQDDGMHGWQSISKEEDPLTSSYTIVAGDGSSSSSSANDDPVPGDDPATTGGGGEEEQEDDSNNNASGQQEQQKQDDENKNVIIAVAVVIPLLILLLIMGCYVRRQRSSEQVTTETSKIANADVVMMEEGTPPDVNDNSDIPSVT